MTTGTGLNYLDDHNFKKSFVKYEGKTFVHEVKINKSPRRFAVYFSGDKYLFGFIPCGSYTLRSKQKLDSIDEAVKFGKEIISNPGLVKLLEKA